VSYRLAAHFGVGITEIDDFQILLERMTTREQQPAIHVFRSHPDPDRLSATNIMEQGAELRQAMATGLEAVIANHLETLTPLVLEGDFLSPSLAAQASFGDQPNDGRVRAVFLDEPDEQQLVVNFLAREPQSGPQLKRARVSWLQGRELAKEARALGLPVVPARPWDTVLERVIAALC
jgi:hypothetical protein